MNISKKIIGALSLTLLISASAILHGVSFGNPFGVMNPDRKMTKQELIKATRLMAAAEFEAVQNYMQVAESTDDPVAKKVFTDIANEERVHAGEFLRLLNYLDPEENTFYQKGATEVEKEIKELDPAYAKALADMAQPKTIEQKETIAQKPEITKLEKEITSKKDIDEAAKEVAKKPATTKVNNLQAKQPKAKLTTTKQVIIEPINVVTNK